MGPALARQPLSRWVIPPGPTSLCEGPLLFHVRELHPEVSPLSHAGSGRIVTVQPVLGSIDHVQCLFLLKPSPESSGLSVNSQILVLGVSKELTFIEEKKKDEREMGRQREIWGSKGSLTSYFPACIYLCEHDAYKTPVCKVYHSFHRKIHSCFFCLVFIEMCTGSLEKF